MPLYRNDTNRPLPIQGTLVAPQDFVTLQPGVAKRYKGLTLAPVQPAPVAAPVVEAPPSVAVEPEVAQPAPEPPAQEEPAPDTEAPPEGEGTKTHRRARRQE